MKLFLTSAGFDNINLAGHFFRMTDKKGSLMKALFIPAALHTPEIREAVPVFLEDLHRLGIKDGNIREYNLENPFEGDISDYDVILFTAGDPRFLMDRIKTVGFGKEIDGFLAEGGIYIGISAGSDIAAENLEDGLGYVPAVLECHAGNGLPAGTKIQTDTKVIPLTDSQALVMDGNRMYVVE